jgi:metal-responsive CopG/Arc/MetJ family transcriptional regulator
MYKMGLTADDRIKKSFLIPKPLYDRLVRISEELGLNFSEMLRRVIKEFIERYEKGKLEKELEEGYKANYQYYLKTNEEFQYADSE